jgi:hypothetical protein
MRREMRRRGGRGGRGGREGGGQGGDRWFLAPGIGMAPWQITQLSATWFKRKREKQISQLSATGLCCVHEITVIYYEMLLVSFFLAGIGMASPC